jgi:G6PDH family F420-dependent oxidoreductase
VTELGYFLSSEEHPPDALVAHAQRAEASGFAFAMLSDHFHPWTLEQGQSAFAWSVLGAIAHATTRLPFGTAVTCPIMRMHPVIVAHAAATVAAMAPGRFILGVGTGEALNEHVTGQRWPSPSERLSMLEDAISIIRDLWTGELVSRTEGAFRVDRARLTTLPERPPRLYVAATGPNAARLAASNDGLIAPAPIPAVTAAFEAAGGDTKPRIALVHVCWHRDIDEARDLVLRRWPNGAFTGAMHTDLALPEHFEAAAKLARAEHLGDVIVGPDLDGYVDAIRKAAEMGFDHVLLHQIGDDQQGFLRFFERELQPAVVAERSDALQLDRMVEATFPASDPISTWAGSDRPTKSLT